MNLGVVAASAKTLTASPPPTYGVGVTLNSARLTLASISSTDNRYFSFAGWFKTDWTGSAFGAAFAIDPAGSFSPAYFQGIFLGAEFAVAYLTSTTGCDLYSADLQGDVWQHIIGTVDTTSTTSVVVVYINDSQITFGGDSSKYGPGNYDITCNGKTMWVGEDASNNHYVGSICDLSIWPGVSFLTTGDIAEVTRRLFIDAGGRPVDPATAIAALGSPAVLLSGPAASFASNALGTSGVLTLSAGTITNAATNP